MAILFSFFKTPKHRVFNYQPRYYEPKDERQQELRTLPEEDRVGEEENVTHRLRSRMHRNFQQTVYHHRRNKKFGVIIRVIVIAALGTLLFMLFYFTKMMEVLMRHI